MSQTTPNKETNFCLACESEAKGKIPNIKHYCKEKNNMSKTKVKKIKSVKACPSPTPEHPCMCNCHREDLKECLNCRCGRHICKHCLTPITKPK